MARVVMVVGRRGQGLAETVRGVRTVADVVVAGLEEALAQRHDRHELGETPVISAPHPQALAAAVQAEALRNSIDGVVTFADDAVDVASTVSFALGVRGLSPSAVGAFRDKARQRHLLQAAGLQVPGFVSLRVDSDGFPSEEQLDTASALGFPAIVKPSTASGGALAFVVGDRTELAEVLTRAVALRAVVGAVGNDTDFVVEQVIPGQDTHPVPGFAPYVSVEGATVDGRHRLLAVTDRFPVEPPVLETGMSFPTCLDRQQELSVQAVTERALDAVGLDQGLSHTEVMLTADGPVVIEVNARVGGALPYLFPLAGGPDLFAVGALASMGVLPQEVELTGTAVFVALQHPLGVSPGQVRGWDEMRGLPESVLVIELPASPGADGLQAAMAGLVLGRATDAEHSVDFQRRCRQLFECQYAGASGPRYLRRTPDGVVHPPPRGVMPDAPSQPVG